MSRLDAVVLALVLFFCVIPTASAQERLGAKTVEPAGRIQPQIVAEPGGEFEDFVVIDRVIGPVDDPVHGRRWGPEQVTGPPNTPRAGDIPTAWASLTQDGQEEWLQLKYPQAVVPTQVVIYETHNPGAVYKVTLFDDEGDEIVVWQGKDPSPVGAGGVQISKVPIKTNLKTNRIRIYLKSQEVDGWNEVDAVGLVARDVPLQWASDAEASSTYAEQGGANGAVFPSPNRPVGVDAQLWQLVKDREKQLALLVKRLRATEQQLEEQAKRFEEERARMERTIKTLREANHRLQDENDKLQPPDRGQCGPTLWPPRQARDRRA